MDNSISTPDYSNGRFVIYNKGVIMCNSSLLVSCVSTSLIYNSDINYIINYGYFDVGTFRDRVFTLTNPSSYVSSIINKEIKETFDIIKSPENSLNTNIKSLEFAKLRKLLLYIIWILENHYHIKIHEGLNNLTNIEN